MKQVRRGYHEEDAAQFSPAECARLSRAAWEIATLMERDFPQKPAVTFVANHYQFTERQRSALLRITASFSAVSRRKAKQLARLPEGGTVQIDAFNAVVLMETALSGGLLLKGMDGCYRDLSGLAGTYAIIAATPPAIDLIFAGLKQGGAGQAVFWVDAPVSNSGRLKSELAAGSERAGLPIDIRMVHDADRQLIGQPCVVSGDSEVIEGCVSWYNLYADLLPMVEAPFIVELDPH
jgi:hypothetical protein